MEDPRPSRPPLPERWWTVCPQIRASRVNNPPNSHHRGFRLFGRLAQIASCTATKRGRDVCREVLQCLHRISKGRRYRGAGCFNLSLEIKRDIAKHFSDETLPVARD